MHGSVPTLTYMSTLCVHLPSPSVTPPPFPRSPHGSPFRPIPLFRPAIPSSDALSSQLHIGSPLTLRVQLSPHHNDATPAPDRPVTLEQTRSMPRRDRPPPTNSRSSPLFKCPSLRGGGFLGFGDSKIWVGERGGFVV